MEYYNKQAEKSVIGSIIKEPETFLQIIKELKETDFYFYKSAYKELLNMFDNEISIDMITVENNSTLSLDQITEIVQTVDTTANLTEYIKIIKDKSTLKQLADGVKQVVQKIKNFETGNINELLVECKSLVDIEYQGGKKYKSMQELTEQFLDTIEYRQKRAREGIIDKDMYGFPWLDKYTSGTRPGEVTVLAGLTSMGKTAMAGQIAINKALKGNQIGIFSLEMEDMEMVERFAVHMAGINSTRCRMGKLEDDDFYNLSENLDKMSNLPITIVDNCFDIEQLKTIAKDLHLRGKLDYLIIDYFQLLNTSKPGNQTEMYDYISRQIKILAKTLKIPILCLSQFNRKCAEDRRRPQLNDLRGSGGVEHNADLILFLYPNWETFDEKKSTGKPLDVYLEIAKQRGGQCGICAHLFDGSRYKFIQKVL